MATMPKQIVILGATGSIGQSTLNVIRHAPKDYQVLALTGYQNIEKLIALAVEFQPAYIVVPDQAAVASFNKYRQNLDLSCQLFIGVDGLVAVATHVKADIIVAGIVDKAGLRPTLAAARAGKRILLANKESMVMAGPLFRHAIEHHGAQILPIDSEHNALFQALPSTLQQTSLIDQQQAENSGVHSLVLTASGGPFRHFSTVELETVTPAQACKHPNWDMGAKVSVDSASLMNKGLELIEACYLFGVKESFIEVVLHPQSIVHSMVSYVDGTTIAHLSHPTMEVPISFGLAWPLRRSSGIEPLKWSQLLHLDFIPLTPAQFPCFNLARQAMVAAEQGKSAPIVLNAANEIAVSLFLDRKITFTHIPILVEQSLQYFQQAQVYDLDAILELDEQVRAFTLSTAATQKG